MSHFGRPFEQRWKIVEKLFQKFRNVNKWRNVFLCDHATSLSFLWLLFIFNFTKSRKIANFYLRKNSWNFVYIQAKMCRFPYNLTRFFHQKQKNGKLQLFPYDKNYQKNSWNFVTFKLRSVDPLSIWRDFFIKAENYEFYLRKKKSWKNSWNFVYI